MVCKDRERKRGGGFLLVSSNCNFGPLLISELSWTDLNITLFNRVETFSPGSEFDSVLRIKAERVSNYAPPLTHPHKEGHGLSLLCKVELVSTLIQTKITVGSTMFQ